MTRRPVLAAALIYAAVIVVFLGPGLLPGKTLSNTDVIWFEPPWVGSRPAELATPSNAELGDAPHQLLLFLRHTVRELPHIPLWDPYIQGGRPFLANGQSAIFSIYSLPAYVLPFWTALGWIGVLKLWVAAFGTFLLGRALGMRFGGALLAGLVFALNLKMVTWLSYPHESVWTFMPWLLLLTERIVRRPERLAAAGLAVVVALQFLAGHAESSFHVLLTAVLFFALRLWQARRAGDPAAERLSRPLLTFAGGLAGGTALAAAVLLPFAELLSLSADIKDRAGASVDLHLPIKDVIGVALPDYWGRPTQTPIRPFLLEHAFYVGALPLMLTAAALTLRRTAERVWIAIFGAVFFAVVIGVPPFLQIVTRLPVFSSGHNSRLVILPIFALSLLAGWGLDDLTAEDRGSRRSRLIVVGVGAVLLLAPALFMVAGRRAGLSDLGEALRVAWLFAHPPGGYGDLQGVGAIRLASLIVWLTVAGAALLLIVLRLRGRLAATAFVALALLLVTADLFRSGMGYNPAIDRDVASVPATAAIRYLQRQGPARFISTEEFGPNVVAIPFRLNEAKGYDLPIMRRFDRFWRRKVVPRSETVAGGLLDIPLRFLDVTPQSLRMMRLMGVTHLMQARATFPSNVPFEPLTPVAPLDLPGLTLVYDKPDARIYRLDGALPRAFVVGSQRVVDGDQAALDAIASPSFDARNVAITEQPLQQLPQTGAAAPAEGANDARIVTYKPEHVVIRARSSGRGLLILSDNDYPGWKATVDGRSVDVQRVDYLFRGVPLGPGTHTVEMRFEPLSWRIGWIVSLVSLLVLVAVVVSGLSQRGRRA